MSTLGLVVPVYEEAERLDDYGKLLVEFIADQAPGSELLFVDDGSADATAGMLDALIAEHPEAPVRLLRRPHLGKGAAVGAGLRALHADTLAFCDLDLSTPLDQLERVVRAATRAPVLAIGSRDLAGSRLLQPEGRVRETLGRTYNRLLQATLTPGIVDTQCGAKAASPAVWEAILAHSAEDGFAWDAEIVALALALGVEVRQVPIEWRHDERSRVRVGRDGFAMVLATPRIWRRTRATRRDAVAARATVSEGGVFDAAKAIELSTADSSHWWFRSKAALVSTAIRRTGGSAGGTLVDVGGGAGGVTALLGWAPDRTVVLEGSSVLVAAASARHGLAGVQADGSALPLAGRSAEVVCLLDVLEHVVDPLETLREAERVLGDGGRVVINVPAHPCLRSAADDLLGHRCRYTRSMLRRELAAAGLEPVLMSHVFSWLVLPMWSKRRSNRTDRAALGLDQQGFFFDLVAMTLTFAERLLLGRVALPIGTSVLAVAVRSGRSPHE
jgi:dolichyl-phosphate beta-glucosyltransferase